MEHSPLKKSWNGICHSIVPDILTEMAGIVNKISAGVRVKLISLLKSAN